MTFRKCLQNVVGQCYKIRPLEHGKVLFAPIRHPEDVLTTNGQTSKRQCSAITERSFGILKDLRKSSDDLLLKDKLNCKQWNRYNERLYSGVVEEKYPEPEYCYTNSDEVREIVCKDMKVIYDFITEEEEIWLFKEVEPHLIRLRYETSHWDDAIHGYRETQRNKWTEKSKAIIQRIRDKAFPPGTPQLSNVHVLDLKKEGYIKPHVDAVKFCGSTIAGISLLSSSVMRLVHNEDKTLSADILLKRRSLYIMKDRARYEFTHEILSEENSMFNGLVVPRDRRISVICRNEA